MDLQSLLNQRQMSKYHLSKISGVPKTTIMDICAGRSDIERCSAKTVQQLARALNCTMEDMMELSSPYDHATGLPKDQGYLECGLPPFLADSVSAMKAAWTKLDRGEYIVMHRGALKNTPNNWLFSNGPLTINHAFVLKKADRYSVNSENNFQAIRWSSPKHIVNTTEYSQADDLMKISVAGNTFYVDFYIRDEFARTDSMWVMFTTDANNKEIPAHSPFYSNHQLNCCHRKSSGSGGRCCPSSADGNSHGVAS